MPDGGGARTFLLLTYVEAPNCLRERLPVRSSGVMLAGITRIGVKGLVECIRLQTLNRQALQQIQVDVHYLRPQLRR